MLTYLFNGCKRDKRIKYFKLKLNIKLKIIYKMQAKN